MASSLAVQGFSPSIHRAELRYRGQALAGDALEVRTWSLGDDRFAADIERDGEVLFSAVVQTESGVGRGGAVANATNRAESDPHV